MLNLSQQAMFRISGNKTIPITVFCLSNILKHTEEQTDHAAIPMADGAWFWVVVPDCWF